MAEEDQQITLGNEYAAFIRNRWIEIELIREEFFQGLFIKTVDPDTISKYLSKLISLWIELKPKIEGRLELRDLEDEFLAFQTDIINMENNFLITKGGEKKVDIEKLYKLEEVIRKAIEKLGVTKLENEK